MSFTVEHRRPKRRIGDMGMPKQVWIVMGPDDGMVAFYDREKAIDFTFKSERRYLREAPLRIEDAK